MPNIDSEPIDTPSTKLRRAKKPRSMSGAAVRCSTISSRVNAAAASTSGPMTVERRRRSPRQGLECQDHRNHGRGQQDEAEPVGSSARRTVSMRRCRACSREAGGCDAHQRYVQPEYRPPACCVGEQATEQRANTEAQHQEPAPGTDIYGSTLRRRAGADGGERAGDREGGRETLQGPSRQQRGLTARQGYDTGCDAEQCQASH